MISLGTVGKIIVKGLGRPVTQPAFYSTDGGRKISKVGFIGLGNMGTPMVKNMLKKGLQVSVFDLRKPLATALASDGAKPCDSLAQVSSDVDVVITMLPGNQSVLDCFQQQGGIFESAKDGTYFVDSSTVSPNIPQMLAPLAAKKKSPFLDAPVSGGTIGAEAGTLTFMVGGCEKTLQVVEPVLLAMGSRTVHCGSSGMGLVAKLANNMLLGISMSGVAEAMNLGIRLGLDPKVLMSIINTSTGQCWSSEKYNPVPGLLPNTPPSNNYKGGFPVGLIAKDLKLAQEIAHENKILTPLGAHTHQLYQHMATKNLADKDFAYYYKFIQEDGA